MPWPVGIFLYNLAIIVVLAALGIGSIEVASVQAWIPDAFRLPFRSMWFGALGGVVISLKGVYDHATTTQANPWEDRYNLWHFGRPVSGALTGLVTFVLLRAINPGGQPTEPVLYAAAFILGTQERRFFAFLFEVARIIVQIPAEAAAAGLAIDEIQPTHGPQDTLFVLRGRGFGPGLAVSLGGNAVPGVVVSSDGTAVAGRAPQHAAGPVDVTVTRNGATVTRNAAFTYD